MRGMMFGSLMMSKSVSSCSAPVLSVGKACGDIHGDCDKNTETIPAIITAATKKITCVQLG